VPRRRFLLIVGRESFVNRFIVTRQPGDASVAVERRHFQSIKQPPRGAALLATVVDSRTWSFTSASITDGSLVAVEAAGGSQAEGDSEIVLSSLPSIGRIARLADDQTPRRSVLGTILSSASTLCL